MSMNTPSPNSNQLPTLVLFLVTVVGVPGAVAFTHLDIVNKNPLQTIIVVLLYLVGLALLSLLRKVWAQLEDDWSKNIAKWLNDLIQKRKLNYKSYYARFLTDQHRHFEIKGFSMQRQSTYALELEQVFVDLSIDASTVLDQVSSNPIPSQVSEELLGNRTLWDYLTAKELKHQHFVILGAPGTGKTTLLKYLALTLVDSKKMRSLSYEIRHHYQLPFLLSLREYADAINTNSSLSLVEAIQTTLNRGKQSVPEGWVMHQLSKGKCLIMLDGLDEVGDAFLHEKVAKWVQRQMETYATNRFLISSRPLSYRGNPLTGVMILEVQPFTSKQVQKFVDNWYHANEVMRLQKDNDEVHTEAKAGAQDLVRLIEQSPPLSSMAVNPLLLTMISTIHYNGKKLPEKRVELYAKICEVFLEKRQKDHDTKFDLSHAECISILQPLAYKMMENEQTEVAVQDIQEMIEEALELVRAQMMPVDFLEMIEDRSGLLLEREQGIYYFAHPTFQEYLAAIHIYDQKLETVLIAHVGEERWKETTRLYCAKTDATNVVEACLEHATGSISHLTLAFECLAEGLRIQPKIMPQLDKVLKQGTEDAEPHQKKLIAETLLKRRLNEMKLIRKGIYRDTSLISCAEYQLFLDEQRALGKYYQPDHWLNTQFPAGQTFSPIVGVRPSAAQAFCQWLTEREQGIWQYRLSQPGEYQLKQIRVSPEWLPLYVCTSPLGYWQGKVFMLEWMQPLASEASQETLDVSLDLDIVANGCSINGEVPEKNPERINFFGYHVLNLSSAHDRTDASNHALTSAGTLVNNLDLDGTGALASTLTSASDFAHTNVLAHAGALTRASALAINLAHTSILTIDPTHMSDLAHVSARINKVARAGALARANTNSRELAIDLASDLAHASTLIFDLDCAKEQRTTYILDLALLLALLSICASFSAHELHVLFHSISKENKPSIGIQNVLNRGIDIYQRLERLKKRRQGEEFACEGILIIKERKHDKTVSGTKKEM